MMYYIITTSVCNGDGDCCVRLVRKLSLTIVYLVHVSDGRSQTMLDQIGEESTDKLAYESDVYTPSRTSEEGI